MRSDNLKSYLPPFLSTTDLFANIFNSQGQELDNIDVDIADLNAQFDVDTATWALDIYEKDLGKSTDYTKPLDYRRSVIKSKWRGSGKLNATLIKTVCDAFTNGNVEVTFDGTIQVKFTSVYGIPPNIEDLKAAIEQIKPAYLAVAYVFLYIYYQDLKPFTYAQLSGYTHEFLKTNLPNFDHNSTALTFVTN
ncbi:putative phage tail protein [Desulfosporosinus sp. SB140]|uniref:putative phage tail protein n=1 Tax=Desulfosporosinus paludis TaxID=3115649 RepID=UPI00388F996A